MSKEEFVKRLLEEPSFTKRLLLSSLYFAGKEARNERSRRGVNTNRSVVDLPSVLRS